MAALRLTLVLAVAPAVALALLRSCVVLGIVDPGLLPAEVLGTECLAAAVVVAASVVGSSMALALRAIARDTHELVVRRRARDQLAAAGGADVVDFAIHLDRRRSMDLRRVPGTPEGESPRTPGAPGTSASRTLSELKSRLAHIPSVRGGGNANEGP